MVVHRARRKFSSIELEIKLLRCDAAVQIDVREFKALSTSRNYGRNRRRTGKAEEQEANYAAARKDTSEGIHLPYGET